LPNPEIAMSYIASSIGTVPAGQFQWYVLFLETALAGEVKDEVDRYFHELGHEAGANVLVVRGYDSAAFRKSAYEAPAFHGERWSKWTKYPSLLVVMDRTPAEVLPKDNGLDGARVLLFPLKPIYESDKSLSGFFTNLFEALRNPDAIDALEKLEAKQTRKQRWGWLSKYVKIEPGFWGFKVDGNKILGDIVAR
jgi:hypothetical protein